MKKQPIIMLAVIASVIAISIGIYSMAFAQFSIIDSGNTGSIGTIGNVGSNIQKTTVCGNGITETGEECDDGNTINGDGCSSTCTTETSTYAPSTGTATIETPSSGSGGGIQYTGPAICGNGNIDVGEDCDDGNTTDGDGCSSTCGKEVSAYAPSTGVGNVGTQFSGSGGSLQYSGAGSLQDLQVHFCGNGITETGEECDDGNKTNGDGCSNCTLDAQGQGCTTQPCDNPPAGNVSPNFSGLTVSGNTTLGGTLSVDSDGDGNSNLGIDSHGNIFLEDPENEQHMRIWNTLNLLELKSIGMIFLDSPWIAINTLTLDIASVSGSDVDVNVDGRVHANKIAANQIGSFYRVRHDEPTGGLSIVSCDIGTSVTGCSGFNSGGLLGVTPSSTSCQIIGGAVGSSTTATAVCFDPTGIREGNIIK